MLRVLLWIYLHRLTKWVDRNPKKFKKVKCEVLQLGKKKFFAIPWTGDCLSGKQIHGKGLGNCGGQQAAWAKSAPWQEVRCSEVWTGHKRNFLFLNTSLDFSPCRFSKPAEESPEKPGLTLALSKTLDLRNPRSLQDWIIQWSYKHPLCRTKKSHNLFFVSGYLSCSISWKKIIIFTYHMSEN